MRLGEGPRDQALLLEGVEMLAKGVDVQGRRLAQGGEAEWFGRLREGSEYPRSGWGRRSGHHRWQGGERPEGQTGACLMSVVFLHGTSV